MKNDRPFSLGDRVHPTHGNSRAQKAQRFSLVDSKTPKSSAIIRRHGFRPAKIYAKISRAAPDSLGNRANSKIAIENRARIVYQG